MFLFLFTLSFFSFYEVFTVGCVSNQVPIKNWDKFNSIQLIYQKLSNFSIVFFELFKYFFVLIIGIFSLSIFLCLGTESGIRHKHWTTDFLSSLWGWISFYTNKATQPFMCQVFLKDFTLRSERSTLVFLHLYFSKHEHSAAKKLQQELWWNIKYFISTHLVELNWLPFKSW